MSEKTDPKRDNEEITDIESCPNEPVSNETTENEKTMGNRRCTRIVIASVIFVTMAAVIAVAVIYGRPPSWKKYLDFPETGGSLLGFSKDGTILAVGSSISDSWSSQKHQKLDGVKVYDVPSGDQIGQRIPFFDLNDPTLPKADDWSGNWYTIDEDFSLSSDGRTLVVSSVTLGYAKIRFSEPYNSLCGGIRSSCLFGRVSVYDYDGSQWINTNNGPLYEHLVPDTDEWGGSLRVALSGDKSTLATWTNRIISDDGVVGANIMMFARDDDTGEYTEDIGNSIHIDKVWYPEVSLSINKVGSRIAIGGFDEVEVYDYNNDKWEKTPSPEPVDGYHIVSAVLSNSGSRMAVSMRNNGNNFGDEKPDYLRVYQWTTTGDGWVQVGNSIPKPRTGSGLTISGDGSTISMGRYMPGDSLIRVFRQTKNEEKWMIIGNNITGTLGAHYSALSYDGNRIATAPIAGSWRDNPFVTVYDLQNGI